MVIEHIKEIKELLGTKPKVIITTHQNPDGDALGSMLGLYLFFKKADIDVYAISPNDYPEFLQWLPGNGEVLDYTRKKKACDKLIADAAAIFYLDYNDAKRGSDLKDALALSKAKRIMIDHHPYPQLKVDYAIATTEVSSTSELIFEFIQGMDGLHHIDKSIATCIYTGIMTDTGCFSYNSSRTRTFEIVSQLLKIGIAKDEIFSNIYDNFSVQRLRLLGYCLNEKMQVFPKYRTAFIALSLEEQEKFNFTTGDSEGFVNYPLSIKGVRFTALFIERKDKIKISFRSRGTFPSNAFSEKNFSGGGHLNAAGGESNLSLQETIQKFIELLPQYAIALNA